MKKSYLAEWTTAFINDLPDSSFAYIAPGGKKDDTNKTAPRSLRKLPYKDADGKVDMPHLRNALSRLPQSDIPESEQAAIKAKLQKILDAENAKLSEHLTFTSEVVALNDQTKTSRVEVLRVGVIQDRGLKITKQMLEDYVANFKANVYGTQIQVNLGHNRDGEAAGWFKDLSIDGDSLMGEVEWTELGAEKISKKLYKFISAEFAPKFPHAENGKLVGNVFIGAGLTNIPALKGQQPIALSEAEFKSLTNIRMFEKLLAEIKGRAKLSEADVKMVRALFSELPADQQTDEAKGEVEALEKKQADEAAADKAAADAKAKEEADAKAKADKEAADAQALAEKNKGQVVSLSEFNTVKQELETIKLNEEVKASLVLSEKNGVGFLDKQLGEVVAFMATLSAEQRDTFKKLVAQVRSVDFSTRGSSHVEINSANSDEAALMEKATTEAKQLSETSKRPLHECLSEVFQKSEYSKLQK